MTVFHIFGFGGCLILCQNYLDFTREWNKVVNLFPQEMLPLHSSELKPDLLTRDQKNGLANFFSNVVFGRFASITTKNTLLNTQHELLKLMAGVTYKRITDIAKWMEFDQIVMIFEESERTKLKIANYFSDYHFVINNIEVPVERFYANKKSNLDGLIVADFIAHTAGASVMSRISGKIEKSMERKDFELVFTSIDEKYVSYIEITEGHDNI